MDNLTFLAIFIFIFIVIVFFLWLFFGGEPQKFEGLSFLDLPKNDDQFCEIVDKSGSSSSSGSSGSESLNNKKEEQKDSEEIDLIEELKESKTLDNKKDPEEPKVEECSIDQYTEELVPAIKVHLPSLALNYYLDFSLNTKNGTKSVNVNNKMTNKTAVESRGEKYCRSILEKFFEKPFVTARPDFLKNPETGANLELDCYNDELRLALEYNGIQHYVYPNRFHRTEEEFTEQKRRDKYKRDLCKQIGIYLIEVPYTVPHAQLPKYIEYYLPENVEYRRQNGIEEQREDQLWDLPSNGFPKNGYV